MDARPVGHLHCLPRLVDVALVGACQPADDRRRRGVTELVDARLTPHRLGDQAHSVKVAGRSSRETGLHDIHTKARKLAGNVKLLLRVQGRAWRLLAIAQGGVEDQDDIAINGNGYVGFHRKLPFRVWGVGCRAWSVERDT